MLVAFTDHRAGQHFIIPEVADRLTMCCWCIVIYVRMSKSDSYHLYKVTSGLQK